MTDLTVSLAAVTFVVVDLETTGGSPAADRITEFGAVKIAAGRVIGEFASLVDPGIAIPSSIAWLTGITDDLVARRPPVEAVLPAFLEFCHGAVLVAHNARFDLAFLNANLARLDYPGLDGPVVCTATLARRLVREEVRDCRLGTLAEHFRCATEPVHRALPDARATVEVFHGLLERAGSFGVTTLERLVDFSKVRDAPLYRARHALTDGLPNAPGVYAFTSASGEILYVGKATDLRARVRSYFGNDDRRRVVDLLKETDTVAHTVCPTPIEAAVREVRLLAAHAPRFNRRSRTPGRAVFVKLTDERFPRLSVVRARRADGGTYLGPLPSGRAAERVVDALHDLAPLRRCSERMGPGSVRTPCVLAQIGRCLSPCDGSVDEFGYAPAVHAVRAAMAGDPAAALALLARRRTALAAAGRYEEAASLHQRAAGLVTAVTRSRRLAALAAAGDLVASQPSFAARPTRAGVPGRGPAPASGAGSAGGAGSRGGPRAGALEAGPDASGLELVAVRAGRLVASVACAAGQGEAAAAALWARLAASSPAALPAVTADGEGAAEADLVARWLEAPGTRLHHCGGRLASIVAGGRALAEATADAALQRRSAAGDPGAALAEKRLRRGSGAGLASPA